ncbi:MAG: Holliday junction branch migration protein RuvA [Prevotella sp.]|nr:Holliday junction branch migration protein RuvA [Prevotella sp.]
MIDYIKGELTELAPTEAIVEAAGVGYALNISLNTFSAIQGKTDVKLYVHESLVTGGRDDSFTLYGFSTKQEREFYRLLITVSGVGANTARMILSAMSPAELANAITNGDERLLKGVKGIGLKTAQRIIVDLRDKMAQAGMQGAEGGQGGQGVQGVQGAMSDPAVKTVRDEAVAALTMLGFSPAPTAKVVNELLQNNPELHVEQVVKLALKQIR